MDRNKETRRDWGSLSEDLEKGRPLQDWYSCSLSGVRTPDLANLLSDGGAGVGSLTECHLKSEYVHRVE